MREHYANPLIQKAFNVLEILSSDNETRLRAEMREKAMRDEVSLLYAAKKEGETEGRKEGRKKGLKQGLKKGFKEGFREGRKKGRLIGEILMIQRILGHTDYSEEELESKNLAELEILFAEMESRLKKPV